MRLQLRLGGTAEQLFEGLVARVDAPPKEVVVDALAVYDCAASAVASGRQFGTYDPETKEFTAITTPLLSKSSRRQSASSA